MIMKSTLDLENPSVVKVVLDGQDDFAGLCKTISREDYVRLISRKSDGEPVRTHIPRLPQGTLDLEWGDEKNYSLSVYVPADVRPTSYLKESNSQMLPFPNLIFYFEVHQGMIVDSRVFATRDSYRAVGKDTKLCHFPYGNVYPEGAICWGSNQGVQNVQNGIKGIEKVIGIFFNGIMNNDLYNSSKTKLKKNSLEELLSDMVEKDSFPSDILAESCSYAKLGLCGEP